MTQRRHTLVWLWLLLAGCSSSAPLGKESVLVITVPNLRADALNCGALQESFTPQLDRLCSEGVRFTHAYTTSTMTNGALASLLTGLFPLEHGVRHNGVSRYLEGVKSLAQLSWEKGHESILVSGGVPVLRKSAISKGFGNFDDSIRANGRIYRTADDVVTSFIDLLEDRAEGAPFFGVLYFGDLLFPELASPARASVESLEGAYNGKLQDIDTALGHIRDYFKKKKIWEPILVVFTGLQGVSRHEHEGLSKGLNLFNEAVQVPLIIKPSSPIRDKAPSWSVDTPVTLADVGHSLAEYLNVPPNTSSRFVIKSLLPALGGKALGEEDRLMAIESDLPRWRGWGDMQVSLRFGELMYWPGSEPRLYNTYTDRLELQNLYSKDFTSFRKIEPLWRQVEALYFGTSTPQSLSYSLGEKLRVAKNLFSRYGRFESQKQELLELRLRRPDDWQIIQWLVRLAFKNNEWSLIPAVLKDVKPRTPLQLDQKYQWLFVSYIKLKAPMPKGFPLPAVQGCVRMAAGLKDIKISDLEEQLKNNDCQDQETLLWLQAYVLQRKGSFKEASGLSEVAMSQTDRRLEIEDFAGMFWADGTEWDFDASHPGGPAVFDQVLALSSGSDFSEYVKQRRGI